MKILVALFFAAWTAAAQSPEVPHKMQFAGITLTLRDDARREIQKDVNALTQSPRHHMIKVERARTYFPVIEKVFEEERVPDDFKYLVLQESALIADAVSTSNAVGFWQFKDFTAVEMGLRVDKEVDERLNLVSSSRAAARYIKKNNFYFNNWIYALQAYQMGAGGVMRSVDKHESGEKNMEITSSTYWYVKKFLAHKIAFEESVKSPGLIKVVTYENKDKKMLTDLAREISVDETELKQYNKWAKTGTIPGDRSYIVLIPIAGEGKAPVLPAAVAVASTAGPAAAPAKSNSASALKSRMRINGISAIKGEAGDTPVQLAGRAGVEVSDFLKWNDISSTAQIQPDTYYLLGKKRVRSEEDYHKVLTGDNLWLVSQRYGVQMKKLKRYNRLSSDDELKPGTTLWLSSMKPRDADKQTVSEIVQVDDDRSFAWTVDPDEAEANTVSVPKVIEPKVTETPALEDAPAGNSISPQPEQQSVVDVQPSISVTPPPDSVGTATVVTNPLEKIVYKDHKVLPGETLYAIAKQYSVGVMDLVNWNDLNIQSGIRPGQVLKLISPDEIVAPIAETREIEHVVKTTDTLYSVARKYNVTIKELMEWNDKKDFSLSVGEKLKVRTK
ncbi:MAG: LysM peptidoglycan-binding domain-containing protein [Chryseolinea sp.]